MDDTRRYVLDLSSAGLQSSLFSSLTSHDSDIYRREITTLLETTCSYARLEVVELSSERDGESSSALELESRRGDYLLVLWSETEKKIAKRILNIGNFKTLKFVPNSVVDNRIKFISVLRTELTDFLLEKSPALNEKYTSKSGKYEDTRSLFLRLLGFCYLIAFSSLYEQWPGLYGHDGLEPVGSWLPTGSQRDCVRSHTTFACFSKSLGLTVDYINEIIILSGVILSCFVILFDSARISVAFAFLWALYLSLFNVGKTFLSFQWDILLLETGFASILWAPFQRFYESVESKSLPRILIKILFFKLMFMSGVVKLSSQCPTWTFLSALDYHYATQPLPTPLAWYAHQLPASLQRISVAVTLLLEIPGAFLILSPLRSHQQFAMASQCVLQLLIILTGNYTWFNILTITLSLTLIDDDLMKSIKSFGFDDSKPRGLNVFIHTMKNYDIYGPVAWVNHLACALEASWRGYLTMLFCALFSLFLFSFHNMFSLIVNPDDERFPIELRGFNLPLFLQSVLPVLVIWILLLVVYSSLSDVFCSVNTFFLSLWEKKGMRMRFFSFVNVFVVLATTAVACALASASIVCIVSLEQPLISQLLPENFIDMYKLASSYSASSGYGLFRQMTGVQGNGGTYPSIVARPEIVLEAKYDGDEKWYALNFLYKPGNLSVAPKWVSPYQPRLDWQMWFAALGTYQSNPWLVHLIDKILSNSSDVMKLLNPKQQKDGRIEAIRTFRYFYDFTRIKKSPHLPLSSVNLSNWWWTQEERKEEYLMAIEKDNTSVQKFLEAHGWKRLSQLEYNEVDKCALRSSSICGLVQVARETKNLCAKIALTVLAIKVSFTLIKRN